MRARESQAPHGGRRFARPDCVEGVSCSGWYAEGVEQLEEQGFDEQVGVVELE
jgi:hypothetical protein